MATVNNNNISSSTTNSKTLLNIFCKQASGLKVCHFNAQSLGRKVDEFRHIFVNSEVDVICVSETWFRSDVCDSVYALDGYRLYRKDRTSHAGGVAIYMRNTIKSTRLTISDDTGGSECLFIEVGTGNRMLIGAVYRPDRSVDIGPLVMALENLSLGYVDIIIMGDFNNNLFCDTTLITPLTGFGLYPVNTSLPTHFTQHNASLIDIVFVSDMSKSLFYEQMSFSCFSKHDLLFLTYNYMVDHSEISKTFSYRDFRSIDYTSLLLDTRAINWGLIYGMIDIDEQVSFFENNINQLFDSHVPLRTRSAVNRDNPWFNREIEDHIKLRNHLFERWKRYRMQAIYDQYKLMKKETNRLIFCAKQQYYVRKLSSSCQRKKWEVLKEINVVNARESPMGNCIDVDELNERFVGIGRHHISTTNSCDTNDGRYTPHTEKFSFHCVNCMDVLLAFNSIKSNSAGWDSIHPRFFKILLPTVLPFVTYIFNTILTTSTFPVNWKKAKVLPIPKANNDYRPISILSYLSKAFEIIMQKQIQSYVDEFSLLSGCQSGFRRNRSCITALLDVTETIRSAVDNGKTVLLTLLDHTKAFDLVNHHVLLDKLKFIFQFANTSARLIESYLRDRTQSVVYNNTSSEFLPISSGVPQGSVLGPLLFSLYINDLPSVIRNSRIHMYADDVQLITICSTINVDHGIDKLNSDLRNILDFARKNFLQLNASKSHCLVIGRRKIDTNGIRNVRIGNDVIGFVEQAKNLGVYFNRTLTWDTHVNIAVGKVYGILRRLWATRYLIPVETKLMVAKTIILPSLLYGAELFCNLDSITFRKLNVVFNNVARYVNGLRRHDHISSYSFEIYELKLIHLLQLRTLLMLHKIIFTAQPVNLYQKLTFTRSQRNNAIIQIRHKTSFSEKQFFIHAISLWNCLPTSLQLMSNALKFKQALKLYFNSLHT